MALVMKVMKVESPIATTCKPTHELRRKTKKTKEKKNRRVEPCEANNVFVKVFCAWGCGVSYKSLPKYTHQKVWAKTLRKLNAHESQRCPCNPSATRVSCKAKAKSKKAVDDLVQDWEAVLLSNHVEILQQQIRFLRALPGGNGNAATAVRQQIDLLEGSIVNTKNFLAMTNTDEKAREASKLKAAKLAEDERARILEQSSRLLSAAESAESGIHFMWTEPTFQSKEEWLQDLDKVVEMEENERSYRIDQDDSNAVGVFWTEPSEDPTSVREAARLQVIAEEEEERANRMKDPANPYEATVGVFWGQSLLPEEAMVEREVVERYAFTKQLEGAERVRRFTTEGEEQQRQQRQHERLTSVWPQYTTALCQRFPQRAVQSMVVVTPLPSTATQCPTNPKAAVQYPSRRPSFVPPPLVQIHHSCATRRCKRPRGDPNHDAVNVKHRRRLCSSDTTSTMTFISPVPMELDLNLEFLDTNTDEPEPSEPLSPPSVFDENEDFLEMVDEFMAIDDTEPIFL